MFDRIQDYEDVLKFSNDFGYVYWQSDEKRMLFVSTVGHEHVRKYIKQRSSIGQ
jgi:selenocysteine-specific translation elongation factor